MGGNNQHKIQTYLHSDWYERFLKAGEVLKEKGMVEEVNEYKVAKTLIQLKIQEIEDGMI